MNYKNLKTKITCNRCYVEEVHSGDEATIIFENLGWKNSTFGNLCPSCSKIEAEISETKLKEKEVIYKYIGESHQNDSIYEYFCPTCNNEISIFRDNLICKTCGQRLYRNELY